MKKDVYQERYIAHQKKKKKQLTALLDTRSSQRAFNGKPILKNELHLLINNMAKVPSSCNRQSVSAGIIEERNDKEMLGALLVGGVGWIHRADKVLLLFASPEAYKAGSEVLYMPYLDAGAVLMVGFLTCEEMGIGCAYINPNIREENEMIFTERFNQEKLIFCGALAIGRYDVKAETTKKKKNITIK